MRLIDLDASEVRTVAVSPDGRHVAASGASGWLYVFDWVTGDKVRMLPLGAVCDQFAFGPEGRLAYVHHTNLRIDRLDANPQPVKTGGDFAGGVAVAPDGRALFAARVGRAKHAKLDKWVLPKFRREYGYDHCSPFRRLSFSPDGEYLAGIWPGDPRRHQDESAGFELRFAASGGLDFRYAASDGFAAGHARPAGRPTGSRDKGPVGRAFDTVGFVSFSYDGCNCAFGWEGEFYVLDISTGTRSGDVRRVEAQFRDAAFTGSGRLFATVDETGLLKLWDPKSWQVVREYDWGVGPLTSLAFTADGSAGVCGTARGQLVQFDVDE